MMITKNAGKLSKAYFKSYLKLVMSTRDVSLEKAKAYTFESLFQGDELKNGKQTYKEFTQAYEELSLEMR